MKAEELGQQDAGDAWFESLWETYYPKLVDVAGHRLAVVSRRDADEEDVALSAMKSFYRGVSEGRLPRLTESDGLWKLLLTITIRKANKRLRYLAAEQRGGGKVRGESWFDIDTVGENGEVVLGRVLTTTPTADTAEEIAGQCEELLNELGDDVLQRIALLKLEGFTNEEVARKMGCALRTVERKLFRIRLRWSHLLEASAEADLASGGLANPTSNSSKA